jgi:hypothetical protein
MAARSLLVAVAAFAIAACSSPTSPDVAAGTPFDLQVGATATLSDGLRIRFERVRSDSRCPLDALCVRAGEAIIDVALSASDGSVEVREMRTNAPGSQISYAQHTIQLTALAPFPRSTQQIDPRDYVATFVVTLR